MTRCKYFHVRSSRGPSLQRSSRLHLASKSTSLLDASFGSGIHQSSAGSVFCLIAVDYFRLSEYKNYWLVGDGGSNRSEWFGYSQGILGGAFGRDERVSMLNINF